MTETSTAVPYKITHRWSDRVVYQATKATTAANALLEAVAAKADLREAMLPNVVLPYGARLDGARLDGALLVGARLDGASLDGASLDDARLDGARLDGARLDGASLDGASLDGASLDGASLVGARLGGDFVAATSDIAYAGPVGAGRRTVYAFRAKTSKGTVIVFRCGCFIGTERDYLARIKSRYGKGGDSDGNPSASRWLAECKAALAACQAMAKTWPKVKAAKKGGGK